MSILSGVDGVVRNLVGSGDYQVDAQSFSYDLVPVENTFVKLPFQPKLVIYGAEERYHPTYFLLKGGKFWLYGNEDGGTELFADKTDHLKENGFLVPFGDPEDLPWHTTCFAIG